MQQQYDNLQTENLSKDRSSSVLAAIAALESEGFYPGEDIIDCDIKVVTSFNEWEIKAGYSDTALYLTVALSDGSRWLTDLVEESEGEFPNFKELLNGDPAALASWLTVIKQKRYERMMQAIAWVKELIEVRSEKVRLPKREHVLALDENGFQCLVGDGDEYYEEECGHLLETYEEKFGNWNLKAVHREDDLVFVDAIHANASGQYWQNSYNYDPARSLKSYVESLKQLLSAV